MEENKKDRSRDSKIIVSCYVNGVTPSEEDLSHIVASIQATGADIAKLVVNAADITELPRIFHLLSCCQVCVFSFPVYISTLKNHSEKK